MRESGIADALTGRVAGASFRFRTDAVDLAAYARAHLAPLLAPLAGTPDVTATLIWHEGQPPSRRPPDPSEVADMERVDRDLYVDAEHLCWFRVDDLRDLFLRCTWTEGQLVVRGDFYYRLGNSRLSDRIRRVRRWSQRDALRRRRFTTLLYYLVYYPCWWWLEQTRDLHPIHAAAVATDTGAALLAGASGVGKSTLAVALALRRGARLLADSFVLHHGVDLYAVPEPLLLDAWSRNWLGGQAEQLQAIDGSFGLNRRGYHLPRERTAESGHATVLLFPRRAAEMYVRSLTPEQAHQRLSAADLIINDLRRYWAFAAVMEQMAPAGLMARRETQLAALTAGVACYEIGLTAAADITGATDAVMELVHGKQRRVAAGRP